MIELLLTLILCHLVGDYVLQTRFIAESKGSNGYHLFVHCALYCVPFVICFGFCWQLAAVFVLHMIIDPLKARYKKITYPQDQILHYCTLLLYLF